MFDTVKRLREKSSLTTVPATSGSEAAKGDEVILTFSGSLVFNVLNGCFQKGYLKW